MAEDDFKVIENFKEFIDEFEKETDRAIVVLTAARLDYLLFSILQKYLITNAARTDEFFDNQGPGASFSNKIILVSRLGLIDSDFARALHLVRNIRNDFAHETSACSLEKGSHKDRVIVLAAPYKKYQFYEGFKKFFFQGVSASRADYMTVVGFLIIRLHYLHVVVNSIDSQKAWPVFTKEMKEPLGQELKALFEKTAKQIIK